MRFGRPPRLRVVAIADADSFVKWAAHLIDAVPDVSRHLLLVRTPLCVSAEQERAALAGTAFDADRVTRVDHGGLAAWLARDRPDVVVVSGRGPFVRLVQREIDRVHPRPVVVTGLPGISIPAQRGAALYRRHSDLMVVHSRRELRAFDELGRRLGAPLHLGLATLPYARRQYGGSGGTDLVFAAQAIVPRESADRRVVADILRRAALADPTRRVVVKLRSRPDRGETETHHEVTAYADLLADRPDNLVFSHAPMAEALAGAEGLVTVSSTAAIEAMARSIPVIALDTFGVRKTHLNTAFAGSGVLGSADDVVARRFRHPHPLWMRDNYFHDPAESTWWDEVVDLVARRRHGLLPARPIPRPRGGALHAAWQRKSVLGTEDHTLAGAVAMTVATPLVGVALTLRRLRGRRGAMTWADDTTDFTVTPARYQDPIVRRRRPALAGIE
ncbi:DUF6716 putative glycosyltransferase [Microbacterium sp. MC2]